MEITDNIKRALRTLWDYLYIKDPLVTADAIFVFGELNLTPIYKAVNLYRQGLSKYIVFVSRGGTFRNPQWKEGEGSMYYKKLQQLSVPKEAIFWENQTTNTLDEVNRAIPFLKEHGFDAEALILIALPIHQRRVWVTFQKQYPHLKFINAPSDEPFVPSQQLIDRIVAEMKRIEDYGKKSDIEEQVLPHAVKEAWEQLKPYVSEVL